jgi:hypothetical protein
MKYNELTLSTKEVLNSDVKLGDIVVRACDQDILMPVIDAQDTVITLLGAFKVDQIYSQLECDEFPRFLTIIGHTHSGEWKCIKRYFNKPVVIVETNFTY